MRHWLMKSEPDTFGIEHLRAKQVAPWDGVRNYQARNNLKEMGKGDQVLFYHSSTNPTGVAGLAEVVRTAYPDPTALDPASPAYDAKSTADVPRWFMVDVRFVAVFPHVLTIVQLRQIEELKDMVLFRTSRLSVQPVTAAQFRTIVALSAGDRSTTRLPRRTRPR